jgi:hypothetical protein
MAKYVNGKLVQEERKVGLTVNAFTKDSEIDEVTLGSHLGQGVLTKEGEKYVGFSHYRHDSKLPVTLAITELGKPTIRQDISAGMHDTGGDTKFDALNWLDEVEKVEALTDAEKLELSDITYDALRGIMLGSHEHEPPTTPKEEAAIAILQHDDLPKIVQVHNTASAAGPLVGSVVTLTVGEQEFNEKCSGFECRCEPCRDGRILFQYNWTGIPLSVLDEPAADPGAPDVYVRIAETGVDDD